MALGGDKAKKLRLFSLLTGPIPSTCRCALNVERLLFSWQQDQKPPDGYKSLCRGDTFCLNRRNLVRSVRMKPLAYFAAFVAVVAASPVRTSIDVMERLTCKLIYGLFHEETKKKSLKFDPPNNILTQTWEESLFSMFLKPSPTSTNCQYGTKISLHNQRFLFHKFWKFDSYSYIF